MMFIARGALWIAAGAVRLWRLLAIWLGFMLVFGLISAALAHETMGHWQTFGGTGYLYGHRIGAEQDGGKVNCCLFNNGEEGSRGDCKLILEEDVQIVAGGYLLKDGEFIPHSETSVSPPDPVTGEYHYYGCQHTPGTGYGDNPKRHCFFAPPTGS